MRFKPSLSHGISDINNVINKIERYINARKRKGTDHVFKISEQNRFVLKEMLKRIVQEQNNDHGRLRKENNTDLMLRLMSLRL